VQKLLRPVLLGAGVAVTILAYLRNRITLADFVELAFADNSKATLAAAREKALAELHVTLAGGLLLLVVGVVVIVVSRRRLRKVSKRSCEQLTVARLARTLPRAAAFCNPGHLPLWRCFLQFPRSDFGTNLREASLCNRFR
jgi:hypothetical protein